MLDVTTLSLIAISFTLLSSVAIIVTIYLRKKPKPINPWETTVVAQAVTNSAPISRRTSTSCLINLEKPAQPSRSRSASFSEDLSARLQILAVGSSYRSYSPTVAGPTPRSIRPSLNANTRFPNTSSIPSTSTNTSVTLQLRYENTIETLFITIFQLQNYFPIKISQNTFVMLYLLPNDDEQRQTHSSNSGVFNEHFHFLIKPNELSNRTLRLTAYTADSSTRIRQTLGHVFVKLDQFLNENSIDKTFATKTLSESLIQDPQIRSDYLGELILTNTYIKERSLLQIRIQQINHLHMKFTKTSLEAHFSGQTSNIGQNNSWMKTSTFPIPASTSFRIDQELNLLARSSILTTHDEQIDCHLRLHIHGTNETHSHARWKHSLRSNPSQTITVPLVAF